MRNTPPVTRFRISLSLSILLMVIVTAFLLAACAKNNSPAEENMAVVRHYFEAINQGQIEVADAIITPDFVKHNNDVTSSAVGPEVLKSAIRSHIENNDGYAFYIEDLLAGSDRVAARWVWQSTNIKYGTPQPVTSQGISIFLLEGRKIKELWQAFDVRGFNRQLGFTEVPPPAPTGN
ncbi:ester cyclase [Candidatus Neomarinimicrobiota bacterium]